MGTNRTRRSLHGRHSISPLGAVIAGVIAGAVGTVAMDLLWFSRHRGSGGKSSFMDWESSAGLQDWGEAPAPAQVGKRLYEGLFQKELAPRYARATNNVTHWAYGMGWGALFGILAGSTRPRVRYGLVFGPAVWLAGYAMLAPMKLYKPVWEYDSKTLAGDLSAHLLYGTATAAAFKALAR